MYISSSNNIWHIVINACIVDLNVKTTNNLILIIAPNALFT